MYEVTEEPGRTSAERKSLAVHADGDRLLMRMLDQIAYAVVLVDGVGHVHYCNALGRDELLAGDPLCLRDGIVGPSRVELQGAFQRAIGNALKGRRDLMTFSSDVELPTVAISPIADRDESSAQWDATHALLVFGRRPQASGLAIQFFANVHELTCAESVVLNHLATGFDPVAIAARQGVAISTIRTQISSIRAKTRKSSIRDLLNGLSMLPPICAAARLSLRRCATAVA